MTNQAPLTDEETVALLDRMRSQYSTVGVIHKLLETVPADQVHTLLRTAEVQWERKVLSDG